MLGLAKVWMGREMRSNRKCQPERYLDVDSPEMLDLVLRCIDLTCWVLICSINSLDRSHLCAFLDLTHEVRKSLRSSDAIKLVLWFV